MNSTVKVYSSDYQPAARGPNLANQAVQSGPSPESKIGIKY